MTRRCARARRAAYEIARRPLLYFSEQINLNLSEAKVTGPGGEAVTGPLQRARLMQIDLYTNLPGGAAGATGRFAVALGAGIVVIVGEAAAAAGANLHGVVAYLATGLAGTARVARAQSRCYR
jgi:hypothetical protein